MKNSARLQGGSSTSHQFFISDNQSLTLENGHHLKGCIKNKNKDQNNTKLVLNDTAINGDIGDANSPIGEVKVLEDSKVNSKSAIHTIILNIQDQASLEYHLNDNIFLNTLQNYNPKIQFQTKDSKLKLRPQANTETITLENDFFTHITDATGQLWVQNPYQKFTIQGDRIIGGDNQRLYKLKIEGEKKLDIDVKIFAKTLELAANTEVYFKNFQQGSKGEITIEGNTTITGNITSNDTIFNLNEHKMKHKNGTIKLD